MASLYNFKRETLAGPKKQNVTNITTEIEKVRSQSPVVNPAVAKSTSNKKIAFKNDIDELNLKISSAENSLKTLQTNIKYNLDDTKNDISNMVNEIISDQKKYFNTLKVENLKETLDESIKNINNSLKNVAKQLVDHLDAINEIKSRLTSLEDMLIDDIKQ